MNLPAIVEATLEGLGTLLHIGTTSYDNTKTASDTLYKPCFWTVRSKGKEYNKEDRKETDAEYVAYVKAVQVVADTVYDPCRAVFSKTASAHVLTVNDVSITFTTMQAGVIYPISATKCTSTDVIFLY